MIEKRPIDRQREAAATLEIGGEDKSAIKEFLSTTEGLYVIKETGIFKIRLADDIDPGLTNPNVPNFSQQIIAAGYDNEIVARVLLTAEYLFDENNATVDAFVGTLFEKCLILARHILELDSIVQELTGEIHKKRTAFASKSFAPNAFSLPSIPNLRTRVHNVLSKADNAKNTILNACRLQFLPNAADPVRLDDINKAAEVAFQSEPGLVPSYCLT